jgi:hypothetical protein
VKRSARGIVYPTSEQLTAAEHLRLHSSYVLNPVTGCWDWTRSKSAKGYPVVFVNGRYHQAHRLMYVLTFSQVTAESDIDHRCRNTSCVNPAHLEAVPHAENVRRAFDANYNPAFAPSQERLDEHVARRLGAA